MFSHIMVGSNDIEASKVFYDAVLGTLGCKPGILSVNPTGQTRYLYIHENNMFIITEPINDEPAPREEMELQSVFQFQILRLVMLGIKQA